MAALIDKRTGVGMRWDADSRALGGFTCSLQTPGTDNVCFVRSASVSFPLACLDCVSMSWPDCKQRLVQARGLY